MSSGIQIFMILFIVDTGFTIGTKEDLIYENESDFETILRRKYFVDKSLFIEEMLNSPSNILITAPSGWGKSTNMKMLKKFLELQVSEEGHILSKAYRRRHVVNDTNNYHMFMGNSLKITQNKKLMNRHFGKYPVIHVDFKCQHKIKDSEYSVICFREIIHKAFVQHKYLCKSEKLTKKEKRFIENWSDTNGKYKELYGQDVTNALHKLSIILNKQFSRRKLFILIDNYDHPSSDAMFRVRDGKELNRVLKFNLNIIATVLNTADKYQCKAVILGKSFISAAGIYNFDRTQLFRFLGNHTVQKYFGLSKKEVEKLFLNSTSKLSKSEVDLFHAFHGGFGSLKGDIVYNFDSVFNFAKKRILKINSKKFDFMRCLKVFCKINFIRRKIEVLAKGNIIYIDNYDVFTINDLINLRDILVKDKSEERLPENILFHFLLEQGYLTIAQPYCVKSSLISCKLPNLETKYLVCQKLKKYYDEIYLPDKAHLSKCVNFFKSITPSLTLNPLQLRKALYWFYTTFEKLLKYRWTKFSEIYVYRLLFSVVYHLDDKNLKDSFVTVSETNNQFNCLLVRKKIMFIVGLKVNDTSQHVLEHLVGKAFSGYFDLIPALRKKKPVYIGLGVGSNLFLSISCLANGNDTAVHIP